MSDKPFVHPIRVAYVDTDQGGVVHHAAYLRFMEAARIELLRARGIDYRLFEKDLGLALPVADAHVRYRKPAHFDDLLRVETSVGHLSRAKLRFDYKVWRDDILLTEAEILCACVRLDEMRICSMHPSLLEALL